MSNIAGKAYAINVITPIKWYLRWINKLIFFIGNNARFLGGLLTLSLIHYARWTIVKPGEFPRLDSSQPKEDIKYSYMLFFSNFNGSWAQYVDSFSMAIPTGLNGFWFKNVKYPNSVPINPFHEYISDNQIWTNHYYSAYPMATSNDVKSAKKVKNALQVLIKDTKKATPAEFQKQYNRLLIDLQHDLCQMAPTPIVSLAAAAITSRRKNQAKETE